jgi:hypothetical protein
MCVFCDTTEHQRIESEGRGLNMMHVVTRHKLYDGAAGTVYLKRTKKEGVPSQVTRLIYATRKLS